MAIKIRLTRTGSKKHATYRVVAINSETKRDGRPLEYLGWYNPQTNPVQVNIDKEKLAIWLARGAEPSDTVRSLIKKIG